METPDTMMQVLTPLIRSVKRLMLSILVLAFVFPGVHVHAHTGHDGHVVDGPEHVFLDAHEAVFAHAHDILEEAEICCGNSISGHQGNGFHIHLLHDVLSESRGLEIDPPDSVAMDADIPEIVGGSLNLSGFLEYIIARNPVFPGQRFISVMTSLPPPITPVRI